MKVNLDYDEQCDILFGRIRRLCADIELGDLPSTVDELADLGLKTDDLGVSGEQVEMVLDAAKTQAWLIGRLKDAVETAWGVISNAHGWPASGKVPENPSEWFVAAMSWRDHHYSVLKDMQR